MNKFLIITHSTLAEGFYNSTKFLSGLSNNIKFINAYVDNNDWTIEAKHFLSRLDKNEHLVVLTDIFGGSVNQKMALMLDQYSFVLITGVNLPLVLSLVLENKPLTKERCENLISEARTQLKIVSKVKANNDNEEADFLS